MRICLVCTEIFEWGKYGGFGRATRILGRELVARGHEAVAVVPRRGEQRAVERLDGIEVLGFPAANPWAAMQCYAAARADVYHSQEVTTGSWLAQRAAPHARHVISFRDHKFWQDWLVELRRPSRSRLRTLAAALYESNPLVRHAIRRADRLLCVSQHLQDPVRLAYGLEDAPELVGTPVEVPAAAPVKAERPLAVFLGRLDPRKRPERFIELAAHFSHVDFVLAGTAQDSAFEAHLRKLAAGHANIRFAGFLQQFTSRSLSELLGRAWVLVNCSTREGLPTSALEALAHGCALLSNTDVTGWTRRFGVHAGEGDGLERGLHELLDGDRWRVLGAEGRAFVRQSHAIDVVLDRHLQIYRELIA